MHQLTFSVREQNTPTYTHALASMDFWERLEHKNRTLFVLNSVAALVHFISFIVIVALQRDWKVPIHRTVAAWTSDDPTHDCFEKLPDGTTNECFIVESKKHVGYVSLMWETASFFLLSAVFQALVSFFWLSRTHNWIMQGISPLRWFEYSISASVMIMIIAQLSGMYSLQMQLVLFTSMASVMCFGLLHEYITLQIIDTNKNDLQSRSYVARNKGFYKWASHLLGWFPYLGIWSAVFISFFSALAESNTKPPWQVYSIIIGLFFGFSGFAFVQLYYTNKFHRGATMRQSEDAKIKRNAEMMYIMLSLFTKTFLAWNLFAGVLMRDNADLSHRTLQNDTV